MQISVTQRFHVLSLVLFLSRGWEESTEKYSIRRRSEELSGPKTDGLAKGQIMGSSLFLFLFCGLYAFLMSAQAGAAERWQVSRHERRSYLQRAQVWHGSGQVSEKDLLHGPSAAFAFNQSVACTFNPEAYHKIGETGLTKKFWCLIEGDDDADGIKVKYAADNGEVFAEVAATRLFWALGFYADTVFPVRVSCRGCPEDPWRHLRRRYRLAQDGITDVNVRIRSAGSVADRTLRSRVSGLRRQEQRNQDQVREFPQALIDKKFSAKAIYRRGESDPGWSFDELDLVSEQDGGAPRAHVDALKLLAAFVQHSDSKPQQQRLACPDGDVQVGDGGVRFCQRPVLMVQDLGATFGSGAVGVIINEHSKMDLAEWRERSLWKNAERCEVYLQKSFLGTLRHPVISEAGRQFLADLLQQLSDEQIATLFTAARVDEREGVSSANVADWVTAFKERRREIVEHRCAR